MIRLIAICGISVFLGGCPVHTRTVTSDYCQIYSPIQTSRLDTEGTRKQVRDENAAYDALCVKQAAEEMLKR